ncbi:MAG: hypothetical protein DI533_02040 [Cereibacter sphaeroides]|uniref:Copper chaperone PCu(A)C n=1 Tax=Cereibacter sphaeroides TaxID=1063 RepID=A0A2W5SI90_CERSP|nr:MAG: hypothetical protein DI533_02040 [Cereibacter sphaeroides]
MTRFLGALTALLLATAAYAHEFKAGDLEIIHPNIPAPAATARTAAGYLSVKNNGSAPDTLIGITADFAKMSTLHESRVDANGMATMSGMKTLEIPAGSMVSFASGSLHIMFMGLKKPLAEGAMLPATLKFRNAGDVAIEFKVEPTGKAEHHSAHAGDPTN